WRGRPPTRPAATESLHLALRGERVERSLHGALACSEREREGGAGPRFTVAEEREDIPVLLVDGPREDHDLARAPRRQHEPTLRPGHVGERLELAAKPSDFDSEPGAMRFIGELRAERPRDEVRSGRIARPRFA